MPLPAILAVAGAAASIGGAAISSHATSSAANTAANAATQTAQMNNALTTDIYNRNTANFQPYLQSGARGNALIDSFIYGPSGGQPQQGTPQSGAPQGSPGGSYGGTAGYPTGSGGFANEMPIGSGADGWAPNDGGYSSYTPQNGAMPASVPGGVTTQAPQNALNGYDAFVASPYYQNPLAEGFRALNGGLASSGRLESGDAIKRAIKYGQDYGASRQDEYLSLVNGQVNRGYGAASALSGVGQNMVNNITANNNNAADAVGNAALLRAQGTNALVNGIGSGLGQIFGGIQSSYKKGY